MEPVSKYIVICKKFNNSTTRCVSTLNIHLVTRKCKPLALNGKRLQENPRKHLVGHPQVIAKCG